MSSPKNVWRAALQIAAAALVAACSPGAVPVSQSPSDPSSPNAPEGAAAPSAGAPQRPLAPTPPTPSAPDAGH